MARSVWDEFKDLFKSKEQVEREKQKEVDDALQREKDVVKQLEELDKQYRDSLPEEEEPNLEELFPSDSGIREHEYVPESDEELEARAKSAREQEKAADIQKLEDSYGKKAADIASGREDAAEELESTRAKLDGQYAAKSENAKDNALEQGVARGSILSSVLSELSEQKASDMAAADGGYRQKLAEIDDKLATLQKELDSALEQLDIKYAIQLNKDIDSLKKKRAEETLKWEEYNRDVRKQQAEYAYKREEDIAEYLNDLQRKKDEESAREMKYGYTGEKQKNYAQRYEIAYDFYMSLDPSIALDALEASPNMQYYLGYYYKKLKSALSKRTSDAKLKF